jgi:hypothetical protein
VKAAEWLTQDPEKTVSARRTAIHRLTLKKDTFVGSIVCDGEVVIRNSVDPLGLVR